MGQFGLGPYPGTCGARGGGTGGGCLPHAPCGAGLGGIGGGAHQPYGTCSARALASSKAFCVASATKVSTAFGSRRFHSATARGSMPTKGSKPGGPVGEMWA